MPVRPLVLRFLRLLGHQNWIRYGVRDRIIRYLCNPDLIDPYAFQVEFFGLTYHGDLSCYLDWSVYFYGGHQKDELFLLRDLARARTRPIFIDVGANVGQHSLFMSQHCHHIHAFEPYEPVRRQLELQIRHNGITNITVHPVGLGREDCELDYFAPRGHNTGTGSFIQSHAMDNNELMGTLPVAHADRYFAAMDLQELNLIKVDVEGFEKDVLMGMRHTLVEHRPMVLMEFSTETQRTFESQDELMSLLPDDYLVKCIQPNGSFLILFGKAGYHYADFDFNVVGSSLLFFPRERYDDLLG